MALQESRSQDTRPTAEEGRTHKRKSTNLELSADAQAELAKEAEAAETAEASAAAAAFPTIQSPPLQQHEAARPPAASDAGSSVSGSTERLNTGRINVPAPTLESLPGLAEQIASGQPEKEMVATISLRIMLSQNSDWIQCVVDTPNVVPKLVEFLSRDAQRRLQFEATWALTNIASGTSANTTLVVNLGALPPLIRLLDSPSVEIREQAVWALGNIAGDSPEMRDRVLAHKALPALTRRLDTELMAAARKQNVSLMRNAVWTLANLCRGKPPPQFDSVSGCIPTLARVLNTSDVEMLADACWAFNYLGDGDSVRVQAIIDSRVCPRLAELVEHEAHIVKTPALRAIGNVVTGDIEQTDYMLELGILARLRVLLADPRHNTRSEACWTVSNITAGSHAQIQRVIDADILPRLVACAMDREPYVVKEAVWALSNITMGGSSEQVIKLGHSGGIAGLCKALESAAELNNRVALLALEGLANVLAAGDVHDATNNEFVPLLKDCGGEELLKTELQHHVNDDVRLKARDVVVRYLEYHPAPAKPPPELWTPEPVKQIKEERAKVLAQTEDKPTPEVYLCPISQELMVDPVSTADGHVYDRHNIQRWFNTGNISSPVTGAPLPNAALIPNHPLRQLIELLRPGHTHRADLDTEWSCVACTTMNKPTDTMCLMCGAEKPLRKVADPDAVPAARRMLA